MAKLTPQQRVQQAEQAYNEYTQKRLSIIEQMTGAFNDAQETAKQSRIGQILSKIKKLY